MAKQLTTSSAPFFVQQSPDETRKQMLAQALAGNALSYNPNYASLLGPIAQTMAGAMSGYMMGQAGESYDQRQTAARDDMARALAAYNDPTTYTDPSQGIGPVPYQNPPPEQTRWQAMQGTMAQNPDLAPYGMLAEYNRIGAEQAAGLSPDYIKIADPNSKTGVSWALKTNPFVPIMDAPAGSQGLNVNFNDAGGISSLSLGGTGITTGGDISAPTPRTVGDVQEKAFNTSEGYERMYRISQLYRPEYQQVPTRLGLWGAELKDKFGGLDETDKRQLYSASRYRKATVNNLNLYFNELSGAAVSPEEAVRLTNGLPNPGTGVWDGDSPTVFEAALDESMRGARMSMLRYNVWMKVGDRNGNPWDIPFSDVGTWLRNLGGEGSSILNEYAAQVERQLAPRYKNRDDLREAVKETVKQDLMFEIY